MPSSHLPLEAVDSGEGSAFLALHGGMGGADQSRLLARALLGDAPGWRTMAVSRPGYLGSPLGDDRTPERQADLYAELLDSLGIERAVVAAVSAGGPSALQFALRYPQRCRALILVSCCTGRLEAPPDISSRLRVMSMLARVPGLLALMHWSIGRNPDKAAQRAIPDPVTRARTLAHPEAGPMLRSLQRSVFERLRARLPGTINDTMLFADMQRIPFEQIAVPTLVIHGTADRVVPFAHAQAAAMGIPGAELASIEGGEHVALFTHLDAVRARTARFLGSLGA